MSEPALSLAGVHAGYGGVRVLNGLSLSVGPDETVALLGPNGSGKSTLAKTIMNLTTLYEGRVVWEGRDLGGEPAWKRAASGLGYLPQVENVFPSLSVEENLLLGGRRFTARESARQLAMVFDLFPLLKSRRRVTAGNLSGGERRMLAFAATVVQRPRMLILDEPTSDLAPEAIERLFGKIREVLDQLGVPLLLVEQNVGRALELADRVCIMVRGELRVDRPAGALTEDQIGQIFLEHAHVDGVHLGPLT